jgi:hypothetical protein
MGADGPQAEERAIAADAHLIARVPCDEFLFFVFLAEAILKKTTVCPVKKIRSCQISNCGFLFEQSYLRILCVARAKSAKKKHQKITNTHKRHHPMGTVPQ